MVDGTGYRRAIKAQAHLQEGRPRPRADLPRPERRAAPALARSLPRRPATPLAWHRRFIAATGDYTARRRTGGPPTRAAIKTLVLRLVQDHPRWDHQRLQAELARLGHRIAASTVGEILNAAGLAPPPRRSDPTWPEFLTPQAEGTIATDLFHLDTALGRR